MRSLFITAILWTLICGSAGVATAGTFTMRDTWFETSNQNGMVNVRVGARAEYVGTSVDPGDNHWSINTTLNAGVYGSATGAGNFGSGITLGMIITCSANQHGAFADLPECTGSGGDVSYSGSGQAAIYHQNNPEIAGPLVRSSSTSCDSGSGGGGAEGTDPSSGPGTGYGTEPILIDLDRRGFRFTDAAGGVLFDLDADGTLDQISWTVAEAGDAFLVLDRNGNGMIDDGRELFGDKTEQPPSSDPHGFIALAVFDQADQGGDEDGWITAGDQVFEDLRLWSDLNHDGISQPSELATLADEKVGGISLDFVDTRRHDRYGNFLRFKSKVRLQGAVTQALGVYFQRE